MVDWHLCIRRLRPDSEYGTLGDVLDPNFDYDALIEWRDLLTSKPTLSEVLAIWPTIQAEIAAISADATLQQAAKTVAAAIPNWATWSQANFQAWYDANISPTQINAVTSLAEAKPILLKQSAAIEALSKMVIAIRNQLWPDLQA